MKKSLLIILMVFALSLTGCQAKQTSSVKTTATTSTPATKTQTTSAATASTASTSSSAATKTTEPPAQLDTIESDAEDIMDDITNSDWTAAQSKVNEIKTSFSALKTVLVSVQVSNDTINGMNNAITGLETAVGAKKSYDARSQANQISKYVPDVIDYYKVLIPTNVSRLDYLGREINLNIENSDWTSAASNCETAIKLWGSLKYSLNATYQKDIDTFQSNLDSLKPAIDQKNATETSKQASALLDNVDTLETDFKNQNKT